MAQMEYSKSPHAPSPKRPRTPPSDLSGDRKEPRLSLSITRRKLRALEDAINRFKQEQETKTQKAPTQQVQSVVRDLVTSVEMDTLRSDAENTQTRAAGRQETEAFEAMERQLMADRVVELETQRAEAGGREREEVELSSLREAQEDQVLAKQEVAALEDEKKRRTEELTQMKNKMEAVEAENATLKQKNKKLVEEGEEIEKLQRAFKARDAKMMHSVEDGEGEEQPAQTRAPDLVRQVQLLDGFGVREGHAARSGAAAARLRVTRVLRRLGRKSSRGRHLASRGECQLQREKEGAEEVQTQLREHQSVGQPSTERTIDDESTLVAQLAEKEALQMFIRRYHSTAEDKCRQLMEKVSALESLRASTQTQTEESCTGEVN
ncbi:hypothetical protein GN244_ATG03417 [Phytophthora infestans]|uniref:Uncharacterized protein n=1 Tax=Phytophthora infestans TaxID=4787 RepID=A0A833SAC0_PHYIN|nr:hypothetical protein GN244_ATG03417 [Phytophthora infestans]